jgi:hypothetical protein
MRDFGRCIARAHLEVCVAKARMSVGVDLASNMALERPVGSVLRSPPPLSAGVDMTSTVKGHDDLQTADAVLLRVFMVVARAIGRAGACNCDG